MRFISLGQIIILVSVWICGCTQTDVKSDSTAAPNNDHAHDPTQNNVNSFHTKNPFSLEFLLKVDKANPNRTIVHRKKHDTISVELYLTEVGSQKIIQFDFLNDTSEFIRLYNSRIGKYNNLYENMNLFYDKDGSPIDAFNEWGYRLNWIPLNDGMHYSVFVSEGEVVVYAKIQVFDHNFNLLDSHPIALQGGDEMDGYRRFGQFNSERTFSYTDFKEHVIDSFLVQEKSQFKCSISKFGKVDCNKITSERDSIKLNRML